MAKVFSVSEPVNNAERIVMNQLKKNLSNDFYLLNNRSFQMFVNGKLRDFEIDFLLLSRKTGIMTIEVKGYNKHDNSWFKTDESGNIRFNKDPFQQAGNNCYEFAKYLSNEYFQGIPLENLKLSYCWSVIFPLDNFDGIKNLHKNCLVKKDLNSNLQQTLVKLAGPTDGKNNDIEKLWKRLSQKIECDSDYRLFVDMYNERLVNQSEQQFKIFKKFDRGLIRGRPGTGKTILAIQKAKQLAEKGHRVLLVCHNRALGKYLKHNLLGFNEMSANNIKAEVWCDFMDETLMSMRDEVAVFSSNKDYHYYHFELPDRFIERIDDLEWRPTAIVVDEGQNFSKKPYIALQKYLDGDQNNPFLVFYDPGQDLYQGKVTERASKIFLDEFKENESLNESYRLSKNIVDYLEKKFPDIDIMTFNEKLEKHLSEAREFSYENEKDQFLIVEKIIKELKEKKFGGKNIVILSYKSSTNERLYWRDFNIESMKTIYGPDENKIFSDVKDDEILVYSIGKFIGLEADAVIMVDMPTKDSVFSDPDSEEARRFILGATRAKLYLYCLFKESDRIN